jgi:hypothetical protein
MRARHADRRSAARERLGRTLPPLAAAPLTAVRENPGPAPGSRSWMGPPRAGSAARPNAVGALLVVMLSGAAALLPGFPPPRPHVDIPDLPPPPGAAVPPVAQRLATPAGPLTLCMLASGERAGRLLGGWTAHDQWVVPADPVQPPPGWRSRHWVVAFDPNGPGSPPVREAVPQAARFAGTPVDPEWPSSAQPFRLPAGADPLPGPMLLVSSPTPRPAYSWQPRRLERLPRVPSEVIDSSRHAFEKNGISTAGVEFLYAYMVDLSGDGSEDIFWGARNRTLAAHSYGAVGLYHLSPGLLRQQVTNYPFYFRKIEPAGPRQDGVPLPNVLDINGDGKLEFCLGGGTVGFWTLDEHRVRPLWKELDGLPPPR